jgi:hypothetical protein
MQIQSGRTVPLRSFDALLHVAEIRRSGGLSSSQPPRSSLHLPHGLARSSQDQVRILDIAVHLAFFKTGYRIRSRQSPCVNFSVADPRYFGTEPDPDSNPRVRASD